MGLKHENGEEENYHQLKVMGLKYENEDKTNYFLRKVLSIKYENEANTNSAQAKLWTTLSLTDPPRGDR